MSDPSKVQWRSIAPLATKRPSQLRKYVELAAPLVVAGLFALSGRRLIAAICLAVAAALVVVAKVSPPAGAAVRRAMEIVGRAASEIISTTLLFITYALVFVPVALSQRLRGLDSLRRRPRRGEPPAPSYWDAIPTPRRPLALHKWPFLYDPAIRSGSQARSGGRALIGRTLRVLGELLIANLVLGALLRHFVPVPDLWTETWKTVPAFARESWSTEYLQEFNRCSVGDHFFPLVGFRRVSCSGKYVNVGDDGVRRSYQAPTGSDADVKPVEVFFFGGSTTWGDSARDEHTIPSEVARLAEQDHIPLRVTNHGEDAFYNWQEVMLFTQSLERGAVPDVAVFYDGANELITYDENGEAGGLLEYARALTEHPFDPLLFYMHYSAYEWAAEQYRVREATSGAPGALGSALSGGPMDPSLYAESSRKKGEAIARQYARELGIAKQLSDANGVSTLAFWQPLAWTKTPLFPEEARFKGLQPDLELTHRVATETIAKARIPVPFYDVTGALDTATEATMVDPIHLTEYGNQLVAKAIWSRLKPVVLEHARRVAPSPAPPGAP